MQVPGPFEYERATSVDQAIGLLDRLGDGALIVAGGHSLLPMMKLRIANPEYLVDINDLATELGYIVVEPTLVRIGAMARHRQVLESDELATVCPIFRDAERVIADPVVRNRGTIGGSLCQADPAEDLTTVNTVLNAVCVVRGPSGQREVPIDDFLEGPYETSLAFNEMLVEVRIPLRHNSSSAYAKVERRVGDWAVAAAGAAVTLDNGSIAAARIGLTAVNADEGDLAAVSDVLVGKAPTEDVFVEAGRAAAAACAPVTDPRGSAEYKRHLAGELTVRTLRTAVQRVREAPEPQGN
jgi:carbon-monoxide dehydrogenase medium subunit